MEYAIPRTGGIDKTHHPPKGLEAQRRKAQEIWDIYAADTPLPPCNRLREFLIGRAMSGTYRDKHKVLAL